MAMVEESLSHDIKLTKTEEEKKRQNEAAAQLFREWPLPANISDLKSYAWGRFTWRDIILSAFALIVPVVFMLGFQTLMPLWLCVVIGFVIGLPFLFLVNKHHFSGDLPIEERIKLSLKDRGQSNLLYWDKTKQPNGYVGSSSQSFVPSVEFTDENIVLLPDDEGGFMVIQLTVDDMNTAKFTETRQVVNNFNNMLNALIQDNICIPIQIMLKSTPKNLTPFIEEAIANADRFEEDGKFILASRADDYAAMLSDMDQVITYYYDYYIIITYRKDAEGVGDSTMKSAKVAREQIKEKANPLRKKQEAAARLEFEIGDDRKQKVKEMTRASEFGKKRTITELGQRAQKVFAYLRDMGSTNNEVKPRILEKEEIAKLFFQCYNISDKNTVDDIIAQAIAEKHTMFSANMYNDFPELFSFNKRNANSGNKVLMLDEWQV